MSTLKRIYGSEENLIENRFPESSSKKSGNPLGKFLLQETSKMKTNENANPDENSKSKKGILNLVKAYSPLCNQRMNNSNKNNNSSSILTPLQLISSVNNHNNQGGSTSNILYGTSEKPHRKSEKESSKQKTRQFWSANKETHMSHKKIKHQNSAIISKKRAKDDTNEALTTGNTLGALNSKSQKNVSNKSVLAPSRTSTRPSNRPMIALFREDDFEIGSSIGKGRFGQVFFAQHKLTELILAMKVMNKNNMTRCRASRQLVREIKIHSSLDHPNIVKSYGVMQSEEDVYILMEYASGGNLYSKLKESGPFSEPLAAKYLAQVVSAFRYLQNKHILHRDLKPENLLLDFEGNIKLADFGWSIQLPESATLRQTFCGTLDYISPEMAQGEFYGIHTDNWSIGILCFELLTGSLPFVRTNVFDMMSNPQNYASISYPDEMSKEAREFIGRLLTQDPLQRMNLSDALHHPFLKKSESV